MYGRSGPQEPPDGMDFVLPLQEFPGDFSLCIIAFPPPGLWTCSFKPQAKAQTSLWGKAFARELNEQGGEL